MLTFAALTLCGCSVTTTYRNPWLGVTLAETVASGESWSELIDEHPLVVSNIIQGASVDLAGVKTGDRLIEFDGQPVRKRGDITERLHDRTPGDVVPLVFEREGEQQTVNVTLQSTRWQSKRKLGFNLPLIDFSPFRLRIVGLSLTNDPFEFNLLDTFAYERNGNRKTYKFLVFSWTNSRNPLGS